MELYRKRKELQSKLDGIGVKVYSWIEANDFGVSVYVESLAGRREFNSERKAIAYMQGLYDMRKLWNEAYLGV